MTVFDANVAALRDAGLGAIVDEVTARKGGVYRLVGTAEAGTLNLADRDGHTLYPTDALTSAHQQAQAFLAAPDRLFIDPPQPAPRENLVAEEFLRGLYDAVGGAPPVAAPGPDAGGLIAVGAGLGVQLVLLYDRLPVKDLVVYESDPDILYWSWHVIPWAGLLQKIRARGGRLSIIGLPVPEAAASEIVFALRGANAALVDGSYMCLHIPSPLNEAVRDQVRQRARFLAAASGFVEDEVLMYRNAAGNLRDRRWRVVPEALSLPAHDGVAVVVGSGPSFDATVARLQDVRDKVTVFSSGSALRVLLANGIVPDFHCELENDDAAFTLAGETSRDYRFDGIRLIAADAVDPRVAGFFPEHLMFFRPGTTGSRVFSQGNDPLSLSSPTVANVSARCAVAFGFRKLVLMGVDLGSKTPENHHSRASFYNVSDDAYWRSGTNMEPLASPVPGNFGGTVYTNGNFQFAQMFFEKLFAVVPGLHVLNASDGARIAGTDALPPDELAALVETVTRFDIERGLASLPSRGGAGSAEFAAVPPYREALIAWFDGVDAVLASQDAPSFDGLHTALRPFLQTPEVLAEMSVGAAARCCASGSLSRCLLAGHFIHRRLPAADVDGFLGTFRRLLAGAVAEMREKALAQFADDEI